MTESPPVVCATARCGGNSPSAQMLVISAVIAVVARSEIAEGLRILPPWLDSSMFVCRRAQSRCDTSFPCGERSRMRLLERAHRRTIGEVECCQFESADGVT